VATASWSSWGTHRLRWTRFTGKRAATNPGQVLDRDLQDVVNELWHDGVEAIAINGQRLATTSTIRAAGGAILVDFRPITSPYQVAAIGPDDLDKRFGDSRRPNASTGSSTLTTCSSRQRNRR